MFKKLALAAALTAASFAANAGVQLPDGSGATEIDGEMLLTVWNTENERGLTVDLGVYASELMTGTLGATTFTLDSADIEWLGSGNIRWNVAGATNEFATFPEAYGYYFTSTGPADTEAGFTAFGAGFGTFQQYGLDVAGMTDGPVEENLTYRTEGGNYVGVTWGETAGNIATTFNSAGGSTSADDILDGFIADFVGQEASGFATTMARQDQGYFWALDLASGELRYETPVPAAAWLFGSALLGLAGAVRRRRKFA